MRDHKHTLPELDRMLDNGMEIYKHYYYMATGKSISGLRRKMLSPFRHEKDPSFSIYQHATKGAIFFKDSGADLSGSHWSFVMQMFGIDFKTALEKVKQEILGFKEDGTRDINKVIVRHSSNSSESSKEPTRITNSERDWSAFDLDFYESAGISQDTLESWRAVAAPSFDISKENKTYRITEKHEDPIYVFDFEGGRKKIYRPFSADKRFKWTSNLVAEKDIFGWHLAPKSSDFMFLIAGNRDTMSFHENIGYPCLALASETANLPSWLWDILKFGYKKVFALYDNDNAGHKKAQKFESEYGIIPLNFLYTLFKGKDGGESNDFVETYQNNNIADFRHQLKETIIHL